MTQYELHCSFESDIKLLLNDISGGDSVTLEIKKELIALYGGFRLTMYGTNCESAARHFLSTALDIGYYVPSILPVILKEVRDPIDAWGLSYDSIILWIESELEKTEHYTANAEACYRKHKDIMKDLILGEYLGFSI